MPNITVKLTTAALTLLAVLHSVVSLAQDSRWFRVEVLIFANESNPAPVGAASAEQWDATPTLAYPVTSRFLIDPARVAENKSEFGGESVLDEYGRQIITILTAPPAGMGAPMEQEQMAPVTGSAEPVPTAPAPLKPVYSEPVPATPSPDQAPAALTTVRSQLAPTGAAPVPSLPRPFVLLPRQYREFSGQAGLLQRGGRYSILFHASWAQPVGSEAASLPIVLDHSGDSQQWPRLQGSIKLYLARYLQVETNLWLNTAGDYLQGTWRMPAPPFGPPSLIIEEEQLVDVAAAIGDIPPPAVPGDEQASAGVEPDADGNMVVVGAAATAVEGPGVAQAVAANTTTETAETAETVEIDEVAPPVYPYRHVVVFRQTRRMRSGEVHYIDHPMMGMIIKFIPMTAEQLAAIAVEEAAALGEGETAVPGEAAAPDAGENQVQQ